MTVLAPNDPHTIFRFPMKSPPFGPFNVLSTMYVDITLDVPHDFYEMLKN